MIITHIIIGNAMERSGDDGKPGRNDSGCRRSNLSRRSVACKRTMNSYFGKFEFPLYSRQNLGYNIAECLHYGENCHEY